jgi:hypothetical protein
MKSKELRYNSKGPNPRENLSSLIDGNSYSKKVHLKNTIPPKTDFVIKDLGNGFREIVR